ncbi:MAG: ABC transporter substrate-binding protein [Proteobacteria bacterium]|nr:ABC transporter substrate-binding protein [Pseudomonadota bacterium]
MRATLLNYFVGLLLASSLNEMLLAKSGEKPLRIVSASLGSDEILVDLLMDCDQNLDRLPAVSTFADHVDLSNIRVKVGTIKHRVHSEPESVLKLKPDLVVLSSFNSSSLRAIVKTRNIPHLLLEGFSSTNDIVENIRAIAKLVQCEKSGEKLISQMNDRISKLKNSNHEISNVKSTLVSYSPSNTVMGAETLFDELATLNGYINVVSQAKLKYWPTITPEQIAIWNPKYILLSCNSKTQCLEAENHVKKNAAWKNLPAAKNKQFLYLNERALQTTSHYFGSPILTNIEQFQN